MLSLGVLPWLAAVMLGLGSPAAGQLTDTPTVANFVRKFSSTMVVLGNYAYIDGGEVVQIMDGGNQSSARVVNSTLSIDLTRSWTTTEAEFRQIPRGGSPSKGNPASWTNAAGDAFYLWGGKWPFGIGTTAPTLWKFTADGSGGGTWATETPSNPSRFNELLMGENIAVARANNTVFAIGGIAGPWSLRGLRSDQAVAGMLTYNMETREWTNGTTGFSPVTTLAHGHAQYLPAFGPNGLIVLLGGIAPKVDRPPTMENSDVYDLRNLTFFDPTTRKVYWQTATGDVPTTPRTGFCSTSFRNKDGGHEM